MARRLQRRSRLSSSRLGSSHPCLGHGLPGGHNSRRRPALCQLRLERVLNCPRHHLGQHPLHRGLPRLLRQPHDLARVIGRHLDEGHSVILPHPILVCMENRNRDGN